MTFNKIKNVFKNESVEKIIKNSGWLLFDKFIRLILGFLVTLWVIRYLGPENYGSLAYSLSFVAIFQIVAKLGFDNIVVRELTINKTKAKYLLGTVFYYRLFAGFISLIILTICFYFFESKEQAVLVFLCGWSIVFQCADTLDLFFQSRSLSKLTVLSKLSAYFISNFIRIILILSSQPLWMFALVVSVEFLFAAIGLYYVFKRTCNIKLKFNSKVGITLIKESWPYILSGVSIVIYMRVDQIMIKSYLGVESLGLYASILTLSTLWYFIPTTLSVSISPFITRMKMKDEEVYYSSLQRVFYLFSLLGWLIAIPISLLSPILVPLLYGDDYSSVSLVLSIHIFALLFINMGQAQSIWFANEAKGKVMFYKTFFSLIVCVFLNLILIPNFGLIGAAISTVVTQLTSAVIFNVFISRRILKMQIKALFPIHLLVYKNGKL